MLDHEALCKQIELRGNTLREMRELSKELVVDYARLHNLDCMHDTPTDIQYTGANYVGAILLYTREDGLVDIVEIGFNWENVDRDGMCLIEFDRYSPIQRF